MLLLLLVVGCRLLVGIAVGGGVVVGFAHVGSQGVLEPFDELMCSSFLMLPSLYLPYVLIIIRGAVLIGIVFSCYWCCSCLCCLR